MRAFAIRFARHVAVGAALAGATRLVFHHRRLHEVGWVSAHPSGKAKLMTTLASPAAAEGCVSQEAVRRAPSPRRRQDLAARQVTGDAANPERAHLVIRRLIDEGLGGVATATERHRLDGEGTQVRGLDVGALVQGPLPLSGLFDVASCAGAIGRYRSVLTLAGRAWRSERHHRGRGREFGRCVTAEHQRKQQAATHPCAICQRTNPALEPSTPRRTWLAQAVPV